MKIAESREGNQILMSNTGGPLLCPFQNVTFLPGKLQGQIIEHHKPCGNWCPFFKYNAENKKVQLKCTDQTENIEEVIKDKINLKSI